MEGATYRVLFEGVVRALHSQNFARSSTDACNVLTDLLSRYLKLLALTCANHAHHCGRTDLTALDAVLSLEELGASLGELKSFQEVEGKDLARYAYCSQRRQMDLREIKCNRAQCCNFAWLTTLLTHSLSV
jgi:Wiskott-Aldrich syndrome protein